MEAMQLWLRLLKRKARILYVEVFEKEIKKSSTQRELETSMYSQQVKRNKIKLHQSFGTLIKFEPYDNLIKHKMKENPNKFILLGL